MRSLGCCEHCAGPQVAPTQHFSGKNTGNMYDPIVLDLGPALPPR